MNNAATGKLLQGKSDLKVEPHCCQHPPATEYFLPHLRLLHAGRRPSPGNRCHVVPWEDPGHAAPQGRALEPAVLALLDDPVHLAFAELQLVVLLRLVGVQGQVAVGRGRTRRKHTADVSPTSTPAPWSRKRAETLLGKSGGKGTGCN